LGVLLAPEAAISGTHTWAAGYPFAIDRFDAGCCEEFQQSVSLSLPFVLIDFGLGYGGEAGVLLG
jgi:hypothetical protein